MEQKQRSEGIDLPSLTCQVHVNKFVSKTLLFTPLSTLTTTAEKLTTLIALYQFTRTTANLVFMISSEPLCL